MPSQMFLEEQQKEVSHTPNRVRVTREAQTGVWWPQAKECWQPHTLEDARDGVSLRASRGSTANQVLDFSLVRQNLNFWPAEL